MRRQAFLTEFPIPSGSGRWWVNEMDAEGVYVDQSIASWFGFKSKTWFVPFESPDAHPALGQFIHHIQELMISEDSQASWSCEAMPSGLPRHFRIEVFRTNEPSDGRSFLYGFLTDVSHQVGLEQQINMMVAENQWVVEQHRSSIEADTAERARRLLRLEMGFGHTWVLDVKSQQVQPDEALAAWAGCGWKADQWYPIEEMMQSVPTDFHDEFRSLVKEHCTDLAEGDTFSFEHPQIRRDVNQLLWVKVFGKLFSINGRKQIHGQVVDITAQHDKQTRLEQLVRRQKELFGIIGHELQTPIAALQMHLQNIDVDDETRSLVQQALTVTNRMQRAVNDTKTVPAMQVPTRPAEVIRRQLAQFQKIHSRFRLRFEFDERTELQELMLNTADFEHLVSSALTDAVAHAQFDIVVRCSIGLKKPDVQLVVTVEDDRKVSEHGIVRGSDVAAELSDITTLGLLEIESSVDQLDGTYHVTDSEHGRVLKFEVNARAVDLQQTVDPGPFNLLIVEDDPFLMMLIRRMLENGEHDVTSATNGEEAVQLLQSNQFDAVLTDLSMPVMNGHDLIRWIRERDSNLPIGVLTASVLGSEITAAIELGANLALQKPIERDTLLRSINQLLSMSRLTNLPRNQSQ